MRAGKTRERFYRVSEGMGEAMNRLSTRSLCTGVVLLLGCAAAAARGPAGEWTSFDVTYEMDPDYKGGPSMNWKGRTRVDVFKERTSKIWIPADMKPGETIRGVMARIGGFDEFAHRNRIARYDGGAQGPYGCVNKTFLKAAAEVTKHPELEHAGAILQGLSNVGRYEAHAAHFWPKKVVAVILDHSWCGAPSYRISGYSYGQCPVAEGVPFFFNSSQKDTFQGGNRRAFHYKWCTSAFNGSTKHPCTSVISYEDVGHGNCGTRSLQAIWLAEVLALRVPAFIDPNGAPYELKVIDPNMVGGHVVAKLDTFEGRTIHNEVMIGPLGFSRGKTSWWVPGPKSAAEILVWVRKNDGRIAGDYASLIPTPCLFESSDRELMPVCRLLTAGRYPSALKSIESMLAKCSGDKEEDRTRIAELTLYKKLIDDMVAEHLAALEAAKSTGDLYHLKELLDSKKKLFAGIAAYDEASREHRALLRQTSSLVLLREGRTFYSLIGQLDRMRHPSSVKVLKRFSDRCPDRIYGRMAARICEDLDRDLNAVIDPGKYRGE